MPQVFGEIEHITLLGFVFRTILVGLIVFFVARTVTKRAVNQLTTYDLVFLWILGAITVSPVLDGNVTFTRTLVPLFALFFWHTIFHTISLKNRTFSFFFNGSPLLLIDDGKIVRKNLKKHFFNADLLISELRVKKVFNIAEVKYCILEPNGHLSIVKYDSHKPVTPKDLNLAAPPTSLPLVLINDGKLFEENLIKADVDERWLREKLNTYRIHHIKDVYLATIDGQKNLYLSKK